VSAPAAPVERPSLRLTPSTVTLLALAVLAWAGVVAYARHMGNGTGSMGLRAQAFLPMWALMMAAMMLPAVAPVAALYARTIQTERAKRLSLFVAGYLIAWAVTGVPALGVLRVVDHVVGHDNTAMRNVAIAVLVAAGGYQLSPLKSRCLRHCRSPLAQLLRYGNAKGALRDLKVSLHHAGYCLGCCWALMALFITFGVMNIWAMLALAAVVVSEKVLRHGEAIGRLAGAACVALAILVLVSPRVAARVVPSTSSGTGAGMTHMGG
jgi:predicted metal-binding membrane protein